MPVAWIDLYKVALKLGEPKFVQHFVILDRFVFYFLESAEYDLTCENHPLPVAFSYKVRPKVRREPPPAENELCAFELIVKSRNRTMRKFFILQKPMIVIDSIWQHLVGRRFRELSFWIHDPILTI